MNARQKRLLRKEQAKKRKKLVCEQDLIETTYCKGCTDKKREYTEDRHSYKTTVNQECGHCPYFKRLNAIGGELLNLSQQALKERESTIMVAKQEKANQPPVDVKYERSELTPERYLKHKNAEKLPDDKIREMYGDYPKSTFNRWKSDNGLTSSRPKTVAEPVETQTSNTAEINLKILQRNYDKLKLEYDSLQKDLKQLQSKFDEAQKLLSVEREINATRKESLKSLETDLEQLKQAQVAESVVDVQALLNQERAKCQALEKQLKDAKDLAEGAAYALKVLQQETAELIQKREVQDEEVVGAINKQMKRFDQYETFLLERILQLKREK